MSARFPFPSFPRGWYVVGFSDDLPAGSVQTVRYFGQDIVVFRTEAGTFAAANKTCPHLGAHLGGGTVEGECLRCPFHAWAFDVDGACVDVPYAPKIPPRARLQSWHTTEHNGVLMVWYCPQGEPPTWTLAPLDEDGWMGTHTVRWEIDSHPQEICENTVDCAHLGPVHDVISTEVKSVERDEHYMRVVLGMVASGAAIGMPEEINEVELDVRMHGLGRLIVETDVLETGLMSRQRIYCTPVEEDRVAIFAAGNTRVMPDAEYTKEMDDIFWAAFLHDFPRDFPIWENKAYLTRPMLAGGDGPIGTYRKWARQFYDAPPAAEAPSPEAEERPTPVVLLDRLLTVVRDWTRRPTATVANGEEDTGESAWSPTMAGSQRRGPATEPPPPQFDSVEAYFDTLEARFNPNAAGELDAIFQWVLTGESGRECFAAVRGGSITVEHGTHASPTLTIEMTADDYLRMINGELHGARAFSTGRGRLKGPVRLAMKMQKLFPLDRRV